MPISLDVTASSDFPTKGAFQPTRSAPVGTYTGFVTKINTVSGKLVYSTYLGGSTEEMEKQSPSTQMAMLTSPGSLTPRIFRRLAGPISPAIRRQRTRLPTHSSPQLNPAGNGLLYSTYLGGSGIATGALGDSGYGVSIDNIGNAYVAGAAYSTDFPTTEGSFQASTNATSGQSNAFMAKFEFASIATTPVALYFGTIPFGSVETLPLTITNTGNTSLTITPKINGPSDKIASSTCEAGVTAGNSCILQVEFDPVAVGGHGDILTLQTNDSSNPTVALHGVASGVGTEMETPLEFGTISFGSTETLLLTINNIGVPETVAIGTQINGTSYKILTTSQNTCLAGITAGHSCTLPVEFDPVAVGNYDDILTLTPSGGGAASTSS